ncbi:hypothetical protein QQP08_011038 [Theobroma cacao]|nr:hypothetical protein QQP08_011038 [Theobroma cacao]
MAKSKDDIKYAAAQAKASEDERSFLEQYTANYIPRVDYAVRRLLSSELIHGYVKVKNSSSITPLDRQCRWNPSYELFYYTLGLLFL